MPNTKKNVKLRDQKAAKDPKGGGAHPHHLPQGGHGHHAPQGGHGHHLPQGGGGNAR